MVYHAVPITRLTIDRLRRCRVIVRCGVGYDNIDHAFAAERGIPVVNVPDYGTEDVADHAIGLMLALTRRIGLLNSRLRAGLGPWSHAQAIPMPRLRGRVFGVVGLGRIGSATALRAKAMGMDVAFVDPYKPDGYDKVLGVRRVESLEELLAQSYVLSLHCPLTPETRHLIDAAAIARMRRGVMLINTSRGAIVDTPAVVAGLKSGAIGHLGLDVYEEEGDLFFEDLSGQVIRDDVFARLLTFPNVLITGHQAFFTAEALTAIAETTLANIAAFEATGRAVHEVSVEKLA